VSGLIHVGANDGSEYLRSTRRLVLIEPQASAYARLAQNFAGSPNVTLVNVAIGSRRGTAELRICANADQSSSLLDPAEHLTRIPQAIFKGREPVRVERLDTVMRGIRGEFDELVVDVQGYELEVFKGAPRTLRSIRRITCEVNTAEMFAGCALIDEIDAHLADFDRTSTDLYGGVWGDAIYERRC
jgi:FkbM family methyltransferase